MNPKACSRPVATCRRPRLLAAYRRGIFPWYSAGQPVLWWSPDPREVLFPAEFRCTRSLAKTLRNRGFEVTFDRDFAAVVDACAARREHSPGTWITPEMRAAYCELHAQGHAHSVEVRLDGALVGGLYGVLAGTRVFRRIDVQPGARCLESRPRPAGGARALWRDSNSSTASYLHRICAPWAASRCPVTNSARWLRSTPPGPTRHCFRHPENCSPKALFWQNSPPSRVPQVTDVERRCDSDGRRSRRDFA